MILRQFAVFVPSFCGSFVLAPDQVSYLINPSVCAGGSFFFCRRAVWSGGFFHFTFPWPGGCGSSRKPQKGAKHGQQKYESRHRRKRRFGSYAQPPALARAYAYAWYVHTGIFIISHYQSYHARVRTHARKTANRPKCSPNGVRRSSAAISIPSAWQSMKRYRCSVHVSLKTTGAFG